MALFGSSGIRGLANKEITPELAVSVGLAVRVSSRFVRKVSIICWPKY